MREAKNVRRFEQVLEGLEVVFELALRHPPHQRLAQPKEARAGLDSLGHPDALQFIQRELHLPSFSAPPEVILDSITPETHLAPPLRSLRCLEGADRPSRYLPPASLPPHALP